MKEVQALIEGAGLETSCSGFVVKGLEPLEWRVVAPVEIARDFYDISWIKSRDSARRLMSVEGPETILYGTCFHECTLNVS